jgi:hypothetical protein
MNSPDKTELIVKAVTAIVLIFLNSWFIQLTWNFFLIDAVTWAKEIGFIQAMGLNALFGLLRGAVRWMQNDNRN